jgi:molybdopterin-synthase adenylyltransferase
MIGNTAFLHEKLYRSEEVMSLLKDINVTICGAGALGANIAENLARTGFSRMKIVDRDRVEEQNLSTQPYHRSDIGAFKAKIMANIIYRALGVAVDSRAEELNETTAGKLLAGSGLVVDTFDNSVARQAVKDYCASANVPGLHVGLAGDYAEIIWNDHYRVPSSAQDDICDYPLARNLVMMAVAVSCEAVVAFAATRERRSYTVTLRDLVVSPYKF